MYTYTTKVDLLEREGATYIKPRILIRAVTHDQFPTDVDRIKKDNKVYVITHDATIGSKATESLLCKESKENDDVVHVRYKSLQAFTQESDFFTFVFDFLNGQSSPSSESHSILIIWCDAVHSEDTLMHYLHAQYLIEKAFVLCDDIGQQNSNNDKKKTLVMLYRTDPERECVKNDKDVRQMNPLLFCNLWKHVFVDALLPANDAKQIQINDCNIFDPLSIVRIHSRVALVSAQLFANWLELAFNHIDYDKHKHETAKMKELLTQLQTDTGLQKTWNYRLHVALESENGVLACFKAITEQHTPQQGSVRSEFTRLLRHKITHIQSQFLALLFENNNLLLYDSQQSLQDNVFLQLLEESKIVQMNIQLSGQSEQYKVIVRHDFKSSYGAKFPFSSHIHEYFHSLCKPCLDAYASHNDQMLHTFCHSHLRNHIRSTDLKVDLQNLHNESVSNLLNDIVRLEKHQVLQRFSDQSYDDLVDFICVLVERACVDKFSTLRDFCAKSSANKPVDMNEAVGNNEWDQFEMIQLYNELSETPYSDTFGHATQNEPLPEVAPPHALLDHQDFGTVEIYAILWSHAIMLNDWVDVLSIIPNHDWNKFKKIWNEKKNWAESIQQILSVLLTVIEEQVINERICNDLRWFLPMNRLIQQADDLNLTQQWDLLQLCILCVATINTQSLNQAFIEGIKECFTKSCFYDIDSIEKLVRHLDSALSRANKSPEEKEESIQYFFQNYVRRFGFRYDVKNAEIKYNFTENLIKWMFGKKELFRNYTPNEFTKMEIATQLLNLIQQNDEKYKKEKDILTTELETCSLNQECVIFIKAQEQALHFQERKKLEPRGSLQADLKHFQQLSNALHSTHSNLDKSLLIAKCKIWTYRLSDFLCQTMQLPYVYCNDGIKELNYKNKSQDMVLTRSDCQQIGTLYRDQKIGRGLSYNLLAEMWMRKGSRVAIHMSSNNFVNLFGFSMKMVENDAALNGLCEDAFQLLYDCPRESDNGTYTKIQELFTLGLQNKKIEWDWFERKYFVHLIALLFICYLFKKKRLFNKVYLKGGEANPTTVTTFVEQTKRYLPNTEHCGRIKDLTAQLGHDVFLFFFFFVFVHWTLTRKTQTHARNETCRLASGESDINIFINKKTKTRHSSTC
ncbi:hypothetical protein RFI_10362 [Reticulomyxa filosa]|uniref:Uncharacterized protein n=1 Tax=Reticulomyxa filosa TaxID=46433 RepID=X6NN02_RETFI|nr:hypothetical protein RFI_10362 [Reticulomyxa filosa]|eukprot:ETO26772.1 hypothetical protein RFI_10362 [Reticulomyxa filosa]